MEMNLLFTRNSVSNIFNNDKFQNLMWNLYERWSDEKEYENIEDYAEPIEKFLDREVFNAECASVKMTKRPFGFKIVSNYSFTSKEGAPLIHKAEISFQFYSNGKCKWSASAIK